MTEHLTQVSLLRLIGVMLVVLTPHFWNVPAWEVLFVLAALGWRTLAALRQWPLPRPTLRTLVTLLAIAGIFASYRTLNGQAAGTALLVAMCALKLLEMRTRRDVMVTIFLLYFVLLTHFLVSQEMWTVVYMLACAIGITAFLIEASHASVGTSQPLPLQQTLRMGGVMVASALPLMLLLFVLFPRIPGPLWGLPADSGAERTGLPDSMSPGDIADLIQSDEPAFRVAFEGPAPAQRDLYWRGPVLDHFDGRKWSTGENYGDPPPPAVFEGEPIRYQITLEPMRTRWLMALDLPDPAAVPAGAYLNADHQLVSRSLVRDRKLYRTASYTRFRFQPELRPRDRMHNLRLPRYGNSGARTLAQQWRDQGLSPTAIVERALQYYRAEPFYYTLSPPKLGEDSVDEFLFETRRGFCEHYASSFTFLMRAAGIPARVVVGFQGGYPNHFGDYYIVSHSDAHAWSEVWLEGRGWLRIDPTGAVSPSRIESGLESALGSAGELPDFLQRRAGAWTGISARWDWLNNQWNYWVLAYGPELQMDLLGKIGLGDWSRMVLALTVLGSLVMAVIAMLLLRQYRAADTADAALKLWRQAQQLLAGRGLLQRPGEGPRDFSQRVAEEEPALRPAMQSLLQAYLRARYLGRGGAEELQALKTAVSALR